MTHLRGLRDNDLHHDDGTHRSTPTTANGRDVARHERRIKRHLEQHRLKEEVAPE